MRARLLLKFGVPIVLVAAVPTLLPAYPIPPAPLWRLVQDADVIVLATVTSVDPIPKSASQLEDAVARFDSATARLEVLERWKGEAPAVVAIPFAPDMTCPSPPHYEFGKTVLAFLTRGKDGVVQTAHLSYGTIYPTPQEIPIFAARTREALALQANSNADRTARIEWLVACAENRATRWHGIYELVGPSSSRSLDDRELRVKPAELLTEEQRARIAQGFVRDPQLDWSVVDMLNVLDTHRDEQLDRALFDAVERELAAAKPEHHVVAGIIPLIRSRAGLDPGFRGPLDDDADTETQLAGVRETWAKTKRDLAKGSEIAPPKR